MKIFYLMLFFPFIFNQNMELDPKILGKDFQSFKNDDMVELSVENFYEFGMSSNMNYMYPKNLAQEYSFLGNSLEKVGFEVNNGVISSMMIFLSINKIDGFYSKMNKLYGDITGVGFSREYLREKGYDISEYSNTSGTIPEFPMPEMKDYKILRSVSYSTMNSNGKEIVIRVSNNTKSETVRTGNHALRIWFVFQK